MKADDWGGLGHLTAEHKARFHTMVEELKAATGNVCFRHYSGCDVVEKNLHQFLNGARMIFDDSEHVVIDQSIGKRLFLKRGEKLWHELSALKFWANSESGLAHHNLHSAVSEALVSLEILLGKRPVETKLPFTEEDAQYYQTLSLGISATQGLGAR